MDQAQQLRNVIKQRNQNNINAAKVITITSGKGGVGKSNLAVVGGVARTRMNVTGQDVAQCKPIGSANR